jgi:hypothetical protein
MTWQRLALGLDDAMPTNRRAISGPLAGVNGGQSRLLAGIEAASSAALTAVRHTPSKLVMLIRLPNPVTTGRSVTAEVTAPRGDSPWLTATAAHSKVLASRQVAALN